MNLINGGHSNHLNPEIDGIYYLLNYHNDAFSQIWNHLQLGIFG